MAHADRGTKLRCPSCGAPFYDLNRDPAICPKCQTQYVAAPRTPSRVTRGHAKAAIPIPDESPAAFEEDEVLTGDNENEESEETLLDGDDDEDGEEMRD